MRHAITNQSCHHSSYLLAFLQVHNLPVAAETVEETQPWTPTTDGVFTQLARTPIFWHAQTHTLQHIDLSNRRTSLHASRALEFQTPTVCWTHGLSFWTTTFNILSIKKNFPHRLKVACCADIPTWDSVLVGKAGTVEDTELWLDQVWTGRVLWGWESENVSAPVSCCSVVALLHTNIHYLGGSGWWCAGVLRADKSHHHNTFNRTIIYISINHPFTVSSFVYFVIKNLSVWWLKSVF